MVHVFENVPEPNEKWEHVMVTQPRFVSWCYRELRWEQSQKERLGLQLNGLDMP